MHATIMRASAGAGHVAGPEELGARSAYKFHQDEQDGAGQKFAGVTDDSSSKEEKGFPE